MSEMEHPNSTPLALKWWRIEPGEVWAGGQFTFIGISEDRCWWYGVTSEHRAQPAIADKWWCSIHVVHNVLGWESARQYLIYHLLPTLEPAPEKQFDRFQLLELE